MVRVVSSLSVKLPQFTIEELRQVRLRDDNNLVVQSLQNSSPRVEVQPKPVGAYESKASSPGVRMSNPLELSKTPAPVTRVQPLGSPVSGTYRDIPEEVGSGKVLTERRQLAGKAHASLVKNVPKSMLETVLETENVVACDPPTHSFIETSSDMGKKLLCPECGRAFSTVTGLGVHRRSAHGS
jgi:hypothetical protein